MDSSIATAWTSEATCPWCGGTAILDESPSTDAWPMVMAFDCPACDIRVPVTEPGPRVARTELAA